MIMTFAIWELYIQMGIALMREEEINLWLVTQNASRNQFAMHIGYKYKKEK